MLRTDEAQVGDLLCRNLALHPAPDDRGREPLDDAAGVLAAGGEPAVAHDLELEFNVSHRDILRRAAPRGLELIAE